MQPDSPLVTAIAPSPNHGERRDGACPDLVILHYTGMRDAASALAWLCDPRSEVSCHYFIDEDGACLQLVPEARRAWHAGRAHWAGHDDINSRSIGIELVNVGHSLVPGEVPVPHAYPPFPQAQIDALAALLADLMPRLGIAAAGLLAHSDVAPGRKVDPGENFPWQTLAARGLGLHVPPLPPETAGGVLRRGDEGEAVGALQAALQAYGYGIAPSGRFGERTEAVVTAFQRHFRPARIDGRADASTRGTLAALLELRARYSAATTT